jgi:cell division protein ZapB
MDSELKSLERKISQFIELAQRLRVNNEQLRQELASARNDNKHLTEKISSATDRLESLLHQLPENDA